MTRAQKLSQDRAAAALGTGAAGARRAATLAGIALLTVFLGGLTGAHLALSNAPAASAARVAPPVGAREMASIGAPVVSAAARPVDLPEVAPQRDEAVLARLYEEPLAPGEAGAETEAGSAAGPGVGSAAGPTVGPARVQLAAMPVPGDIPALVPARRPPLWLRNAVPVSVETGQPMIAIVLDDLGLNRPAARRAIALPAPLTLSFMTYATGLRRLAAGARAAGHELLLHVPMEPRDLAYDPGPRVLRTGMSRAEIGRRLQWGLARFDGFVGINNHMGSKFTAAPEGIAQVMRELRARDLLFLDSMTSPASLAWRTAARGGVPFARRDVFLDHDWRDPGAIRRQLDRLERIARHRGFAVGIGHPHRATLKVLAEWLPAARRRGIALVPISAIVSHQIEIAHKAGGSAS